MQYQYTKSPVNLPRLELEIQESAIITALDHMNYSTPTLDVYFKADLSQGDETILDALVVAHSGEPLPDSNPTTSDGYPIFAPYLSQTQGFLAQRDGDKMDCVAGQTTHYYYQITQTNFELAGGFYWVWNPTDVHKNDYFKMDVIDHDNLLGYGVDFLLKEAIIYEQIINFPWLVDCSPLEGGRAAIPTGMYLRISYYSSGATNIDFRFILGYYDK